MKALALRWIAARKQPTLMVLAFCTGALSVAASLLYDAFGLTPAVLAAGIASYLCMFVAIAIDRLL